MGGALAVAGLWAALLGASDAASVNFRGSSAMPAAAIAWRGFALASHVPQKNSSVNRNGQSTEVVLCTTHLKQEHYSKYCYFFNPTVNMALNTWNWTLCPDGIKMTPIKPRVACRPRRPPAQPPRRLYLVVREERLGSDF
jgi:hypothetical protein